VENRDKFMKNKEHKNLEETQKTRSNVIFFGKSLLYLHVKRNIAHMRRVSACNVTSWHIKNCPQYMFSSLYCYHFYYRRIRNFWSRCSLCALSALSRKASTIKFPVFQSRSYSDYKQHLRNAYFRTAFPCPMGGSYLLEMQYIDIDLCIRKAHEGDRKEQQNNI